MNTSLIAAWYVAIMFLVCGLSHVLHPRLWVELFTDLLARRYAAFYIGLTNLASGLLVALARPEWTWSPAVIATAIGWAWILKGTVYVLAPGVLLRVANPHIGRPNHFRWAGMVMTVVGGILAFSLLSA